MTADNRAEQIADIAARLTRAERLALMHWAASGWRRPSHHKIQRYRALGLVEMVRIFRWHDWSLHAPTVTDRGFQVAHYVNNTRFTTGAHA